MRVLVLCSILIAAAAQGFDGVGALAQSHVLTPMNVETYRVLQRVARNAGWASTAYRNYLIGLFEGLLSSEGNAPGDRYGKLFCLPADQTNSSLPKTFEWLENELNNVVAKAQPNAYVARIFVSHLTSSFPCQG
jgi:hypothetical protein